MKSAARTSLKIFSIMGIFSSILGVVVGFIFLKEPLTSITGIIEIALYTSLLMVSLFSLLALAMNSRGFMIAVGVVGCITIIGMSHAIILFCIAHYEFGYYIEY